MTSETAGSRVPVQDDPNATASPTATDADLTINPEPAAPASPGDAGPGRESATRPPFEDLYGSAYGPPPAYGSAGYASTGYTADPYAPPTPPPPPPPTSDRRKRRQHWAGAILIVLGLIILGNNLGLLWWVEPEYMLPLILVGAGAWLLFGRGRRG